jgi:hypothetical protein
MRAYAAWMAEGVRDWAFSAGDVMMDEWFCVFLLWREGGKKRGVERSESESIEEIISSFSLPLFSVGVTPRTAMAEIGREKMITEGPSQSTVQDYDHNYNDSMNMIDGKFQLCLAVNDISLLYPKPKNSIIVHHNFCPNLSPMVSKYYLFLVLGTERAEREKKC